MIGRFAMRRPRILPVSLIVCWVLAAGCGGPVNVEGKVIMGGKPLAGAQVLFVPAAGGREAGDVTDEEGHFRLKNPQDLGVVPGEYRVTVSKKDYPPGMKRPDAHQMTMALTAKMKETLPAKYTMEDKTPLRIMVPRGGTTALVLEIE
jgi:Carboxypeptidase regulatory-like domain